MDDKDENYSAEELPGSCFLGLDFSNIDHNQYQKNRQQEEEEEEEEGEQQMINETSGDNSNQLLQHVDNYNHSGIFASTSSFDKMSTSFADVMQFSDFGPKLALNQTKLHDQLDDDHETSELDPVYFLKLSVLQNEIKSSQDHHQQSPQLLGILSDHDTNEAAARGNSSKNASVDLQKKPSAAATESKNKRKRPRTKTNEEVESQRMTHIAVERNRRKQMNEHLRVLRALMPGSYVQRGDQASIIGGAIEFVKELEQLLQCLESQKRRRLYGDSSTTPRQISDSSLAIQQQPAAAGVAVHQQQTFVQVENNDQMRLLQIGSDDQNFHELEETAESKSCLADVEVKLFGFDGLIKILCRRRPCQLIKTIAALEEMQLDILHTNITTIEQTVLYSFNVKVANGARFTAEDIANSIQQIFSFIHTNI